MMPGVAPCAGAHANVTEQGRMELIIRHPCRLADGKDVQQFFSNLRFNSGAFHGFLQRAILGFRKKPRTPSTSHRTSRARPLSERADTAQAFFVGTG